MPDPTLDPEDRSKLLSAQQEMARFPVQRSSLIPLLQLMQARLSFLPEAAIRIVAGYLNLSRAEVYSVATKLKQATNQWRHCHRHSRPTTQGGSRQPSFKTLFFLIAKKIRLTSSVKTRQKRTNQYISSGCF